jgi:hypothetical protein
VNALANEKVGDYVGTHFVAAYKKVGTFRKDGETKTGGNVATYFCLPDQTVIHVVPGPVDADTFLREARWAVDAYESAVLEHKDDVEGQRAHLKLAHAVRYLKGTKGDAAAMRAGQGSAAANRLNTMMPKAMPRGGATLARAHWLLWSDPMPQLAWVYRTVWTDILNEQVTDLPVLGR